MNESIGMAKSRIMGILSLVFGITAVIISVIPIARNMNILLGITAIVLGAIELERIIKGISDQNVKAMAIAGIVLGGISIILTILFTVALGAIAVRGFKWMHPGQWKIPELGRFKEFWRLKNIR